MKLNFTKVLALLIFSFSCLGLSAQSFDYEYIGEQHNGALNALYTQPNLANLTEAQTYDVLKNHVAEQTGERSFPTLAELDGAEAPYADLEFSQTVQQMKNIGAITAVQESLLLEFESIVGSYMEALDAQGLLAAAESFKVNRVTNNLTMSEEEKAPLYAFIAVAEASAEFHGDGTEGFKFLKGCCWNCVKRHWAGVLLRDGLGAAIAIINAALTGNPVTTGALILQAGRWSAKYLKRKCGCCF